MYQHCVNDQVLGKWCPSSAVSQKQHHLLIVSYNGVNPLGNYTVVSELLKCGYRSLEAKNQEGQTAVHLASRMGKDDIVKKLIESGANINCRDTAGYTPLHVCTTFTNMVG
jgi:ankyrin repeat protein